MSRFKPILSLLALTFCCSVGYCQVPVTISDDAPPVPIETDDSTTLSTFAESDVSAHHVKTLEEIKKAIEKSDQLRPLQKRRLLRRLNRPSVAKRVTDLVTSQAIDAGYIQIAHGGFDGGGDDDDGPSVLVDLDALIEFIERLIPLIIQIIGLFG